MQASFYIIVCNTVTNSIFMSFSIRGSSAWWSLVYMVRVTALDIQVSLRNAMAFFPSNMAACENTLYCVIDGNCLLYVHVCIEVCTLKRVFHTPYDYKWRVSSQNGLSTIFLKFEVKASSYNTKECLSNDT